MRKFLTLTAAGLVLLPTAVFAHTGHPETSGFASGILHPITGMDHLLAMVAVGLIAAICGGRMLWLMPAAFLGAMLAGAALGLAGLTLPGVETAIVASVIALGVLVLVPARFVPRYGVVALTAIFGLFHGFAHGLEVPQGGSVAGYLFGFVLTTAGLHLAGLLIGRRVPVLAARLVGASIAVVGVSLAVAL
ncbi:MAG: HupE/UreJ family protein [Devosia sp.]|nr:HupE/UreJ family protein [Devosia sp.]